MKESMTPVHASARSTSVFDPLRHHPPRIDSFGYNKETHKGRELLNRNAKNVLVNPSIPVPTWWESKHIRDSNFQRGHAKHMSITDHADVGLKPSGSVKARSQSISVVPEKMTLTKLKEARRIEHMPDISYDLDGDGYVGGRDYVVARRFDQGFKNYLTEEEQATAKKALEEGFESNFVWGVEASGAQREYRIMQKRGAFVDGDDFGGVTATYPKHPISDVKPSLATRTELLELRKKQERDDVRRKKGAMD